MINIVNSEYDCYTILENEYRKKGWGYRRIESPGFPDIILFRGGNYFFVEVKLYKGALSLQELSIDYLNERRLFKPGQLLFREAMRIRKALDHYKLIVFNCKGERVEL